MSEMAGMMALDVQQLAERQKKLSRQAADLESVIEGRRAYQRLVEAGVVEKPKAATPAFVCQDSTVDRVPIGAIVVGVMAGDVVVRFESEGTWYFLCRLNPAEPMDLIAGANKLRACAKAIAPGFGLDRRGRADPPANGMAQGG
jgi:hypothetical protein